MMAKLSLLLKLLLISATVHAEETQVGDVSAIQPRQHLEVKSDSGQIYSLALEKPGNSVLHPNIKVISLNVDNETGSHSYSHWEPSTKELQDAEDVYIDEGNFAAVRLKQKNGKTSATGVLNGMKLAEHNGDQKLFEKQTQNRSDFINIDRKLTPSKLRDSGPINAVIEILVVCDKDLSDLFNQDRKKILDYLTVYFWDINVRFKTIPSNNISIRVTGVLMMETPEAQPFIENARDENGQTEVIRIIQHFSPWIRNQMSSLPKFDVAVVLTGSNVEWEGGVAWAGGACLVQTDANYGAAVVTDTGDWYSITNAAHELAHTLAAPHDDPNLPGGCDFYNGYIMSGGSDELRWYFSPCTDRSVDQFLRTDGATCLKTIDETGTLPIPNDFITNYFPASMDEQCKRRLKNPAASINQDKSADCKRLICRFPNPQNPSQSWYWNFSADLDDTPCDMGDGTIYIPGRCFRGNCYKQGLALVTNDGSDLCLVAFDSESSQTHVEMKECPSNSARGGTILDRFSASSHGIGTTLETAWAVPGGDHGMKCLTASSSNFEMLGTDKCDYENPMQGWDFIRDEKKGFMLSHRVTGKCVLQVGKYVYTVPNCDKDDPAMRWQFGPRLVVFPGGGSSD